MFSGYLSMAWSFIMRMRPSVVLVLLVTLVLAGAASAFGHYEAFSVPIAVVLLWVALGFLVMRGAEGDSLPPIFSAVPAVLALLLVIAALARTLGFW